MASRRGVQIVYREISASQIIQKPPYHDWYHDRCNDRYEYDRCVIYYMQIMLLYGLVGIVIRQLADNVQTDTC